MYTIGESRSVCRATAETTPMVTVLRSPPGLPKANTISPWPSLRYEASGSAGSVPASTLSTARSISLDAPTIRADTTVVRVESAASTDPSAFADGSTTWTRCAPFTTCALVTMYPLGSITNPEPIARCLPITALVFPCSPSSRSEEHTSELQSRLHLVCRLLLEKKKQNHQCIRLQVMSCG